MMTTFPVTQISRVLPVPLFSLFSITNAADARAMSPAGIVWRHFMPILAVSFPVEAFVFFGRQGLKMGRVAAKFVGALVMQVIPLWDWANELLVYPVVNEMVPSIYIHSPVPSYMLFSGPQPAVAIILDASQNLRRQR